MRASHVPYTIKTVRKTIMKRTELETKYLINKEASVWRHIRNKAISVVNFTKKEKKKYYNELNMNKITDNKDVCRTINPSLGDKVTAETKYH